MLVGSAPHMLLDLQKLCQMAQELKPNLILMYTHALSRSINYLAIHSFHRQLFANPVELRWCITRPMGAVGSTNQNW